MSEILDFWENKRNYTEHNLEEKMTEYYRSDFIENYSKWKLNVDDLNKAALEDLASIKFPTKYWKELQYDEFCSRWINLMAEWIKVNKNIDRKDIKVIYDKLYSEFVAERLMEYQNDMYTIDNLLQSIVKGVMIKDAQH